MKEYATERFLAEYGGMSFSNVVFRPRAEFTSPFGFDDTFKTLRTHLGIDRSKSLGGDYAIYNPFWVDRAEFLKDYPSFGTLLILHTAWGFQVRIAHIEAVSADLSRALDARASIKPGMFIGEAGKAGVSKGRHTHTEIVSEASACPVLDEILFRKYGGALLKEYTDDDALEYAKGRNLFDAVETYHAERSRRNIVFLNSFVGDRLDYHNGRPRRFYSSKALFGM